MLAVRLSRVELAARDARVIGKVILETDLATGAQVMDLLFELKARTGATLILITHDRSLAKRCDRIVSLADGRIVSAGAKRKVAAS